MLYSLKKARCRASCSSTQSPSTQHRATPLPVGVCEREGVESERESEGKSEGKDVRNTPPYMNIFKLRFRAAIFCIWKFRQLGIIPCLYLVLKLNSGALPGELIHIPGPLWLTL